MATSQPFGGPLTEIPISSQDDDDDEGSHSSSGVLNGKSQKPQRPTMAGGGGTSSGIISNPFPSPSSASGPAFPRKGQEIVVSESIKSPVIDVIRDWSVATFKYQKQRVQERLLPAQVLRTSDPSLEAAIEGLKASRRKHNSILRLTRESAAAAAQLGKNFALMADLFGDLTLKEREDLRGDYGNLTHLTRGLSRETDKFLAGIAFFADNLDTLVTKTMSDSLHTCDQLEVARIEYDGERNSSASGRSSRVEELERKYTNLKQDVRIKMDFLDENRAKVMRKQITLLSSLLTGYLTAPPPSQSTPSKLDHTLKQFSVRKPSVAVINGLPSSSNSQSSSSSVASSHSQQAPPPHH